ncbi:MAG: hypothetical protein PHO01_10740 [Desulfotomaculaceae bacterium]|nr:hypothetical protein [Desulfotomaculaceae bacterium]
MDAATRRKLLSNSDHAGLSIGRMREFWHIFNIDAKPDLLYVIANDIVSDICRAITQRRGGG